MRVIIEKNADMVAAVAAQFIIGLLVKKPAAVLGLATGSSPLKLYDLLAAACDAKQISFSDATTFNLDEYVGLPAGHEQSYRNFMNRHLFDRVDIDKSNTFLPSVVAENLEQEGQRYDRLIEQRGGIDLQLLGIGNDGHIGFNEPGSSLASKTRLKALTRQTRLDNSRFFDSLDDVPKLAVTMGIGSILKADRCVLIATGESKQEAVRGMIEGPVCARVPASALQLHSDAIVVLDELAAATLDFSEYYRDSEKLQREISPIHAGVI